MGAVEGFEKYKATLEGMEDNEMNIQQEKVSQFLQIVNALLTKYF